MAFGNLKFDTLTTSDAKNTNTEKSLDTSYIFNGSAKAWASITGDSFTLSDNFNVSSITDNGTGDTTVNFTNAIRNEAGTLTNTYAAVCGQDGTAVSTHHLMMFIHGTPSSTQLPLIFFNIDNSTVRTDSAICCCAVFA